MVWSARKFRVERDAADVWSDAYAPRVEDHEKAAEHFESSPLAAEVGIMIASIALLSPAASSGASRSASAGPRWRSS